MQSLRKNPRTCFEGPFGEVVRATGPMAKANPFRFSTKYQDDETDLLYYGYRYFNASTGRWLNQDPIEERGGLNLYGFVGNDGINDADFSGLRPWGTCIRQKIFHQLKDNNNVNSIFDLGLSSLLNSSDANFAGGMLSAIQNDPAMRALDNRVIGMAREKANSALLNSMSSGCVRISFAGVDNLTFGWPSDSGSKWNQLLYSFRHPKGTFSKYPNTWKAAVDELTWAVRHAQVSYSASGIACPDCGCGWCGTFTVSYELSDKLDLRPHDGSQHNPFTRDPYDSVTAILGTLYHDVGGATDNLRTHAFWSNQVKLCE